MATLRRSKPLSKADFDKTIIKQSNQIRKEHEARLISQDEEMKFMINSLIKTSKLKQNKMKNTVRPTLLKMVAEIEKKTSTINTFLQKTAEVGVAANSREIDSTILGHNIEVKYKNTNMNSEQNYSEKLNVYKNDQSYRLGKRLKHSPRLKSPRAWYGSPKVMSPKRRIQSPITKFQSKRYPVPLTKLQAVQSSTHSLTLRHEQKNIPISKQPITKRKQELAPNSQPQVRPPLGLRQKNTPSSTQQLTPNTKQFPKQSYVQQPVLRSKQEQNSNPKRKQVTGIKVAPSTKRLSKQMNEQTMSRKWVQN